MGLIFPSRSPSFLNKPLLISGENISSPTTLIISYKPNQFVIYICSVIVDLRSATQQIYITYRAIQ